MLAASLERRRERDISLRFLSPGAVWRKPADVFCPNTKEARLAMLEKFDEVEIGVRDYPEHELLHMGDMARDLNSFENHLRPGEYHIFFKLVNVLPPEHNIQKQLLHGRKDTLS